MVHRCTSSRRSWLEQQLVHFVVLHHVGTSSWEMQERGKKRTRWAQLCPGPAAQCSRAADHPSGGSTNSCRSAMLRFLATSRNHFFTCGGKIYNHGTAILKGKGVQQYTRGTHQGSASQFRVRYTLTRAINPSIAHGMSVHGALNPLHRTSGRSTLELWNGGGQIDQDHHHIM